MNRYIIIGFLLIISCREESKPLTEKKVYPKQIGDIDYHPQMDGDFERCDNGSTQYYYGNVGGMRYRGELGEIKKEVFTSFNSKIAKGQTGFYTIRFLINCKGETGLYRSYSVDKKLKEFKFEKSITNQLDRIVKKLKGWEVALYEGYKYDYYQYLTFELEDGKLIDITP